MRRFALFLQKKYKTYIHKEDQVRFWMVISMLVAFLLERSIAYGFTFDAMREWYLLVAVMCFLIAGTPSVSPLSGGGRLVRTILYSVGVVLAGESWFVLLHLEPEKYLGIQGRLSFDGIILFILLLLTYVWFESFWKHCLPRLRFVISVNQPPLYAIVRPIVIKHTILSVIAGCLVFFLLGEGVSYILCSKFVPFGANAFSLSETYPLLPPKQGVYGVTKTSDMSPVETPLVSEAAHTSFHMLPQVEASTAEEYCLDVPVLMYHHIEPWDIAVKKNHTSLAVDNQVFDEQMAYLVQHGYTTISADQLITALVSHESVTSKSIVLIFDDAYLDNYEYAYPILKKYNLIGNIAVPTGLLGTHAATNDYFTWDQLKEMVDGGLVHALNHSWSHYPMGSGSIEKNNFETITPKEQLSSSLGKENITFVYPYGAYDPWIFPLLQQHGYKGAFTTKSGRTHCLSHIMELPRIRIGNAPMDTFGL